MAAEQPRPPLLVITGPTASGKTGLAVALAQRLPVDLISADSALVYRGLDIGSAKPDDATLALAPHQLIDIRDPEQAYSAAEFASDARAAIEASHAQGRLPVLVGGTLLYLRALLHGLDPMPAANPALRADLEARAAREGWPALHAQLARLDPASAERIAPADRQRIQRALEVCMATGRTMAEAQQGGAAAGMEDWRVLKLVLTPSERRLLHDRISLRFDAMLEAGFIDEMQRLMARPGLTAEMPSMRAVGYRQAWACLSAGEGLELLRRGVVSATTQLAKRQLTWLRAEPETLWYDSTGESVYSSIFNEVGRFLENGDERPHLARE